MNTLEILRKAYSDPMLAQAFLGVYSVDKLPVISSFTASIIANPDTSESKGSHWISMFFKKVEIVNILTVLV